MNSTVLLSLVSSFFFTLSAIVLLIRRKQTHDLQTAFLPLFLSLILCSFISLSNSMGHFGHTGFSDPLENVAEIIFILLFLFFVNNWKKDRSEETIRRNESFQNKMVANIGDVIAIIDKDGINRYKSPNIEKLFGIKPGDVVGKSTWDSIHPDDLESTKRFIEGLMETPNAVGTVECRYKRKDGSYRWIEFTGSNLLHDEEIHGILGNYHDITERKESEQSLRESEARFKALHNASFGGIAIHDKGTILECNHGLSEISGYSQDELIGMNGLLLIAEASRDSVSNNIMTGYEKPYEAVGLRKNGEEFPLRLEARNVPYKGRTVRTVEFRDITESKQAEEEREQLRNQLLQAQKMESIGRLAGGVAHDFNNMLSVILGFTELSMAKTDPSESIHRDLTEIHKAARKSAEITRQLLAFARQQTVIPKVINLNETIESMLNMLRRLIGEDINFDWLPGVDLWKVRMDPTQIDQIMANLCVNARDATGSGGRITIETHNFVCDKNTFSGQADFVPGDYVQITVTDNGHGMSPHTLENLFEPFFTTKDVNKGTGLGLAMVYGIVKQNKGMIHVYSEPGLGTSFKIYLASHTGKVSHTPIRTFSDKDMKGNETIMVVEDDPSILAITTEMLETMGYTVIASSTPASALSKAGNHETPIHMVVTDVIMPAMNGRDLVDKLRSIHPDIKHLFMSGYTADTITRHGVLNEGINFIQKPFSMNGLATSVRKALAD